MKPPAYSYDWLQAQATEKVFARGEEYYDYHYVRRIEQRGNRIVARVEGTQYKPYTVRITMKERWPASAACNCPYDWGGWCKHVIAVLLEMVRRPERVKTGASAEQLIPTRRRAATRFVAAPGRPLPTPRSEDGDVDQGRRGVEGRMMNKEFRRLKDLSIREGRDRSFNLQPSLFIIRTSSGRGRRRRAYVRQGSAFGFRGCMV